MGNRYQLPPDWETKPWLRSLEEKAGWYLPFLGISELWKEIKGENVTVAVLDTGYTPVKDLPQSTKVLHAQDFTNSAFGVADRVGHSTWCLGAIGALAGNDEGVPGIAPLVSLLAGKVLGDNGSGSDQSIMAGFKWAMDNGADIISMSLGGPSMNDAMRKLFQEFTSKPGKFVVAAAGNDGHPANKDTVNYPAKWPECICVGATNEQGGIAEFSSNGPRVDIFAPGTDMLGLNPKGGYVTMSGTSMATPVVAGIMALMLGKQKKLGSSSPVYSTEQMRAKLKETARLSGVIGLIDPTKLIGGIGAAPPVVKPDPDVPGKLKAWVQDVGTGTISFVPKKQ